MGLKYLVDTNILSEPVKLQPNLKVMHHLQQYAGQYATAVTVWHELQYGIERLPDSKRKHSLNAYLTTLEQGGLNVLPYDKKAATWFAQQRGYLAQQGVNLPYADGEIAAIAFTNHLTLVTRNVTDFQHYAGLQVVNWFG